MNIDQRIMAEMKKATHFYRFDPIAGVLHEYVIRAYEVRQDKHTQLIREPQYYLTGVETDTNTEVTILRTDTNLYNGICGNGQPTSELYYTKKKDCKAVARQLCHRNLNVLNEGGTEEPNQED